MKQLTNIGPTTYELAIIFVVAVNTKEVLMICVCIFLLETAYFSAHAWYQYNRFTI